MIYIIVYAIIFLFLINKLTCGRCTSKTCLVGKTALITGGNSGIGLQVALDLASRGCRVIIADIVFSDYAKRQLEDTDNKNIVLKFLDLASFKSVRQFAKEVRESEQGLHILIQNAGVGTFKSKYTEDGLQHTMQVNYFGHFLLTHLLIDLLKKSAPSRIIFTSSSGAFFTRMRIEDLKMESSPDLYLNSKLCQAIAARHFAERLKQSRVTSNALHPGGVRSNIYNEAFKTEGSILTAGLWLIALLFGKNTEEGAQTTIYLACDKKLENVTGKFFIDCHQFIHPFQCYNKKLCSDVWEKSIEYVKLNKEEIQI